jgi:hypothetical protein
MDITLRVEGMKKGQDEWKTGEMEIEHVFFLHETKLSKLFGLNSYAILIRHGPS